MTPEFEDDLFRKTDLKDESYYFKQLDSYLLGALRPEEEEEFLEALCEYSPLGVLLDNREGEMMAQAARGETRWLENERLLQRWRTGEIGVRWTTEQLRAAAEKQKATHKVVELPERRTRGPIPAWSMLAIAAGVAGVALAAISWQWLQAQSQLQEVKATNRALQEQIAKQQKKEVLEPLVPSKAPRKNYDFRDVAGKPRKGIVVTQDPTAAGNEVAEVPIGAASRYSWTPPPEFRPGTDFRIAGFIGYEKENRTQELTPEIQGKAYVFPIDRSRLPAELLVTQIPDDGTKNIDWKRVKLVRGEQ